MTSHFIILITLITPQYANLQEASEVESTESLYSISTYSGSTEPKTRDYIATQANINIESSSTIDNQETTIFKDISSIYGSYEDSTRYALTTPPKQDEKKLDTNHRNKSWTQNMHPHHSKWQEFGPFFTFTMFIVITGLTKVGFHHMGCLTGRLPESCLLIVTGVIVGAVMHGMNVISSQSETPNELHPAINWPLLPEFTPTLFFAVLLPAVILESAYSLYDRHFAHNILTVLLYAVVGTIFNAFAIGLLLFLLDRIGALGSHQDVINIRYYTFTFTDYMVFGAIASAVDPVAVLAIFHELGVHKNLYFLVFGESLLNDAVIVALYSTLITFTRLNIIEGTQYGVAVFQLFASSLGGMLIGFFGGLLTALVTLATQNCRVVEPLAVLGLAYLTYLISELFHFSSIISIILCGLVQAHYSFKNISHKSYTTVKYFTKMISSTSDSAIFIFLGAELVGELNAWHTGFVMWSIILCFICRYVGVFVLTTLHNTMSDRYVEMNDQIILGYGGLRGATCYALASMLDSVYPPSELFSTTALTIVLFTVFVQGGTMKYLVQCLKIPRDSSARKTLNEEIMVNICNTMMAGVEEIASARGDYYLQRKLEALDNKYMKKIFLNSDVSSDIKHLFEKLSLTEHANHMYTHREQLFETASPTPLKNDATVAKSARRTSNLFIKRSSRLVTPTASVRSRLWHRPQTAAPELVHQIMRDTPYQQFQDRYNPNVVADRSSELFEELRLRRASNGPLLKRTQTRNRIERVSTPRPDKI